MVTCFGLLPTTAANAQNFAATGSRAAGMGGAFVAVADDASAFYWNPAGLASGAFFSLVLDRGTADAAPERAPVATERSSVLLALTTPALGLGYYRLSQQTAVIPFRLVPVGDVESSRQLSAGGEVRLDSLVTHHAGLTLVQSITDGVAVGTTLKVVRGIAGSQMVVADRPDAALDGPHAEVLGRASNQFDLDVGLMVYGGPLKMGLAVRNVREPGFATAGGERELALERQARAGVSYRLGQRWLAAADFDLLRWSDGFTDRRDVALGVEGRLVRRADVRSGLRLNTSGDAFGEHRAAYSVGGSYAVRGSLLLDGHVATGSERTGREWGVAARFVY